MTIDWTKPLVVAGTDRVATISEFHSPRVFHFVEADWENGGIFGRWLERDTTAIANAPPTPQLGPEHIEALVEAIEKAESAVSSANYRIAFHEDLPDAATVQKRIAARAKAAEQRAARLAEIRAYLESL